MDCLASSFEPGAAVYVRDGWGEVLFEGRVVNAHGPHSWIVENTAGRQILVAASAMGVGKMSYDDPMREAVAGMPREMLENEFLSMAAAMARKSSENEGLAEVIAAQCEALGEAAARPPVVKTDTGPNPWYDKLCDLTELYLVRTVGERHPLRIDDSDLRALVSHILD